MKTLFGIDMIGEAYRNGTRFPGWNNCKLSDGTTQYRPSEGLNASVSAMKALGVDCSAYEAKLAEACKPFEPSEAEKAAELYQSNDYGYAKPVMLGKWEFSTTFGRWSRLVRFADGWEGFTYPKL